MTAEGKVSVKARSPGAFVAGVSVHGGLRRQLKRTRTRRRGRGRDLQVPVWKPSARGSASARRGTASPHAPVAAASAGIIMYDH